MCGKKLKKKETVCPECGAGIARKTKANKLGNCALIFAFFIPIIGLILGILALVLAKDDDMLRYDGIKAIIMSLIVTAVHILLVWVLAMIISAAPFVLPNMF